ncbi:major facilitator superfamily domain-containing protein [Aspergillus pseudocaelatus]|uniref:Major facilitator superfamily domain-containing protein n=1 Tax=Aspergillus pseudocaelatus TaxID=1825620 RepID=A0ABQ6W0D2_9EURO|nr:major facilitator superfamily domain-containing protein [Aspergillus pseudocaelatus]
MSAYVIALSSGPALGPVMSGFAVPVLGWRFSMWEILMASGVVMLMLVFLPETSHANILYRRAQRLQQADPQNRHHTCAAQQQHAHLSFYDMMKEYLLIPMRITLLDPAILFVNIYAMLVYGIYYSFFEVFPLVYQDIYGFSTGEESIFFIAIAVGALLAALFYNIYIRRVYTPKVESGGFAKPEDVLKPAMLTAFGTPIALFLFGWAARASVHWIVPTLGIVIYPASISIVVQCIFLYLPACHPKYAASVFAATDFTRSAFACAAVLFSRPMFLSLGVGGGCSLLAGLTILCIFGIFGLYNFGEKLRQRSKFH